MEETRRVMPFRCMVFEENFRRLEGAAALNGEPIVDAANRAFALYEIISPNLTPGKVIAWRDGYGKPHRVLVLDPDAKVVTVTAARHRSAGSWLKGQRWWPWRDEGRA